MKAISVRSPWWWAILHAGKDVENRKRRTSYRGPVLLHASSWHGHREIQSDLLDVALIMRMTGHRPPASAITPQGTITAPLMQESRGCIVGQVDIVGCVGCSPKPSSPWFFGPYGYVLRNPVAFAEPIPCKGALGLFNVPEEVADAARRQAGGAAHA